MTKDKNKLDFNKLKNRKKSTPPTATSKPKKLYKEVEEIPKEIKVVASKTTKPARKKVGRKSWKEEGVIYSRIGFDTPIATKQELKQILATKFFGVSQDQMINMAINDFIKKHSSKIT